MAVDPRAGKPAPLEALINVPRLVSSYYTLAPDAHNPTQQVAFGTSGHRGSAFDSSFNEAHIVAICAAVCEHRKAAGIDGPLFVGMDTHALSEPAQATAIEVFAAHGVAIRVQEDGGYTPTPVISHAIVTHNRGRTGGLADGVVVHEPRTRWLYNNADIELLGGVVFRATHMHVDELAAEALFTPLGITEWNWDRGRREGHPSLSGALHLRPLDMAKIGQMVLDGGRWQGNQLISEEWITESTSPLVAPDGETQRYGYLWTRLSAPLDAGPLPVITAAGWGSQLIHIVPALDTVIVATGGNHFTNKAFAIDGVLLRELVPGVER